MDAVQLTYMLLPNFRFRPDGNIQLGAIIGHDSATKLPNPNCVLNQGHIEAPTSPQSDPVTNWKGTVNNKEFTKVGIWADIATLTGLGAGGEVGGGPDSSLDISCDRMEISSFAIDPAYTRAAFGYREVAAYTKRPFGHPAYLVTGIMVANGGATFELRKGRTVERKFKVSADGSLVGVPVNVGPEYEHTAERNSTSSGTLTEPFILAYELVRLSKGLFKTKEAVYKKLAVFDDSESGAAVEAVDKDWEITHYTPYAHASGI